MVKIKAMLNIGKYKSDFALHFDLYILSIPSCFQGVQNGNMGYKWVNEEGVQQMKQGKVTLYTGYMVFMSFERFYVWESLAR